MSEPTPFHLLDPPPWDPNDPATPEPPPRDPARNAALTARIVPPTLGNHKRSAHTFVPEPSLVAAVNTALAVGAPLLLTGEPGTGKTQVAFYLAWYFGIEDKLFPLYVQSTTTSQDLVYRFDTVGYFHAAHDSQQTGEIKKHKHLTHGPLWHAYEVDGPSIVLLDEIDKAPRDFPNDLLNVLDQHRFKVPELDDRPEEKRWVGRKDEAPPPIVIITSNSERRLPEPFLRRCIFHHLDLTRDLIERAVKARKSDFPHLSDSARQIAIDRFMELRGRGVRKKPATAELLVWLAVLSARGGIDEQALREPLAKLPALGALIKDRDDLKAL